MERNVYTKWNVPNKAEAGSNFSRLANELQIKPNYTCARIQMFLQCKMIHKELQS